MHSNSRFESVRFDSLELIRIDSVSQRIGLLDSTTASSLYAIFGCDCAVDATAAGTKAGKMSVKTSIYPLPSPTFYHSTVECRPAELNRFKSIFWCESNRIENIFGELECTSEHIFHRGWWKDERCGTVCWGLAAKQKAQKIFLCSLNKYFQLLPGKQFY